METINIRKPAVAGRFYPSNQSELESLINEISQKEKPKINREYLSSEIIGAVVPHAGYFFSAYQAVHFYELLKDYPVETDTYIIINPNHTGFGEEIALDSHSHWESPYGLVEQDKDFIIELDIPFSDSAHSQEHSGEVMIPLLQHFVKRPFKIVVITLSRQNPEQARFLARKIRLAAMKLQKKIIIIASSDFTHFKPAKTGFALDELVVEQIKNQDIDKLYQVVKQNNISVCGYGPIMCLMEYASMQGNYKTDILARGHSGQVVASDRVVDYISILFTKA